MDIENWQLIHSLLQADSVAGHSGGVHQLPAEHVVAQTVVVAKSQLTMAAAGCEIVIQTDVELPLVEPVAQYLCTGTEH